MSSGLEGVAEVKSSGWLWRGTVDALTTLEEEGLRTEAETERPRDGLVRGGDPAGACVRADVRAWCGEAKDGLPGRDEERGEAGASRPAAAAASLALG